MRRTLGMSARRRNLAGLAGPSVLVGEPDERLVELARDGDERAFAAIVARYRTPLLRYCLRFLPPGSAEDALQQTFINAHAALSREQTGAPVALRPWLYRIAHNAALNVARDPQLGLARVPEGLDGRERPEDVVQRREHLDRVVNAMKALPDNQREVIARRELGGESHERIAADLGMSAGAVRQLAYRARAAVRAAAAAVIPAPVLRLLPWLTGWPGMAETTAAGSGAVVAKTAVALVVAGAVGGGAVDTMTDREDARPRPRAQAATEAPNRAATAPTRRVLDAAQSGVVSGAGSAPSTVPAAPTRRARRSEDRERRVDNSGPGSSADSSGSDSSGSSSGSGSDSSGSRSSGSSSSGSGSSGSGSSGSGTSGSSGSGSSGSGSSGSGSSGSSGSGSSGSDSGSGSDSSGSGSGSSGSGSEPDADDEADDSSGHG